MRKRPPVTKSIVTLCVAIAGFGMSGCSAIFKREAPPTAVPSSAHMTSNTVVHTGAPITNAHYSEAPIASNFAATPQSKLQATQHWMRIADDAGQSIVKILNGAKLCPDKTSKTGKTVKMDNCGLLYVKPASTVTEFSRAFHNQLITKLVRSGIAVSKAANVELVAEFDVQPISFSANRPQYRYAGVPVELAPGVWAIRDVASTHPANLTEAPPSVDALHWFRSEFAAGQTPRVELLVTVSVIDKRRYLARASNAYYITDADKRLYEAELCSLFKLCGAAEPASEIPVKKITASKTIEVVGDCPLDRCRSDAPTKAKPATPKVIKKPEPEPAQEAGK